MNLDLPITTPRAPGLTLAFTTTRRMLLVILAGTFMLASSFALHVPPYESPDELYHVAFIRHVLETGTLPIIDDDASLVGQEAGQSPLYYILGAAVLRVTNVGLPDPPVRNPHAAVGAPGAIGNKNVVLHTHGESWFPGLALYPLRVVSILLGVIAVCGCYLLARHLFPTRRDLALAAAALQATVPQFLFIAGSVNNDNLVIAVAPYVLLVALRQASTPCMRTSLILGVLLGIAALAKLSGAALAVPVFLCALADGLQRGWSVRWIGRWSATALLAAAISGWWYLRNIALYGDPTGLSRFLDLVGRRQLDIGGLLREVEGIWLSSWAVFGWMNVVVPDLAYGVFSTISIVAMAGLALRLARWDWPLGINRLGVLICCVWLLVITILLARWTMMTMGSQGRLLFPALSVMAILFAVGLSGWPLGRWTQAPVLLAIGVLAVIAAVAPLAWVRAAYPLPQYAEATAVSDEAVTFRFDDAIELLSYRVLADRVQAGEFVTVELKWRAGTRISDNFTFFLHLTQTGRPALVQVDTFPSYGAAPTSTWQPGYVLEDRVRLQVPADAPSGLYQLKVGYYRLSGLDRVLVTDHAGQSVGTSAILGRVKVAGSQPGAPPIQAGDHFGAKIELEGYDGVPTQVVGGDDLPVTLYWRALEAVTVDYSVSIQVLDASGQLRAQHDGEPQLGLYPTSAWDVGERVIDPHLIPLPADLEPGPYQLIVVMYDRLRAERLTTNHRNNIALLTEFEIIPRQR